MGSGLVSLTERRFYLLDAQLPSLNAVRRELAKRRTKTLTVTENEKTKTITLPDYGEVKIICHDGKIKTIETTIKEQM